MTKDKYREYLKTPYWRKRRREKILSQVCPGTCEDCGAWIDPRGWRWLEVHHLSYEGVPYRELDSDLRVLCRLCHQATHGINTKYEEVEKIMDAGYGLTPEQSECIRRACRLFDAEVTRVEIAETLVELFSYDFIEKGESFD